MMMLIKLILATLVITTCDALERETCDCDNIEIVSSDRRTIRYVEDECLGVWFVFSFTVSRQQIC